MTVFFFFVAPALHVVPEAFERIPGGIVHAGHGIEHALLEFVVIGNDICHEGSQLLIDGRSAEHLTLARLQPRLIDTVLHAQVIEEDLRRGDNCQFVIFDCVTIDTERFAEFGLVETEVFADFFDS